MRQVKQRALGGNWLQVPARRVGAQEIGPDGATIAAGIVGKVGKVGAMPRTRSPEAGGCGLVVTNKALVCASSAATKRAQRVDVRMCGSRPSCVAVAFDFT